MPPHYTPADLVRFHSKVERTPEGCWLWTGTTLRGYGQISIKRRNHLAHRFAYLVYVGMIPDGYHLDHLCKQPGCVNPSHLEAVTPAENNRRSQSVTTLNRAKTHCPQGHPYNIENTILRPGARRCRACSRSDGRLYRERYRAKVLVRSKARYQRRKSEGLVPIKPMYIGERVHTAKLTAADVQAIRAEYRPRTHTGYALAERYGVSYGQIMRIVSGKGWRHV